MDSVRTINIIAIFRVVIKHKAITETICQRISVPAARSATAVDAETTGSRNGELESSVRSFGARPLLQDQWATIVVILVVGSLALLGLFSNTAWSAVQTWYGSDTYGHGFLILPVFGFLLWRRRAALLRLVPNANFGGVFVVAGMAMVWLLGNVSGTVVVEQFAFVTMIQAFFFTVLGWRVTKAIVFPLFYLYFAIPFGEFMIPSLQDFTARFVVQSLRSIGMPVYLDGFMILIPSGSFYVAEACAGLRFLISTVALGFLVANLIYRDFWRRLLFVGLSILVPIIANGFRAFGIVMIAHLTDYELAASADHVTFGLVFLSVVTLCLLALGMTFREKNLGGLLANPPTSVPNTTMPGSSVMTLVAAGICGLLVTGSVRAYSAFAEERYTTGADVPQLLPAAVPEPWRSLAEDDVDWHPEFPMIDAESLQIFANRDRQVRLYRAYYTYQHQGAEVASALNRFADRKTWTRAGGGQREVMVDETPLTVRYIRMLSRTKARIVWYWYWVDGRFTSNPYIAKLLEAKAKILGGVNAAAVIAIATDYTDTPAEAEVVLQNFLDDARSLQISLEQTAERQRHGEAGAPGEQAKPNTPGGDS